MMKSSTETKGNGASNAAGDELRLKIDGQDVTVAKGATVLDAARVAGKTIPTLCHMEGRAPFTSCMMCTVLDKTSGKSFAGCSIPAVDGMDIETESEQLNDYRRTLLELILSEHLGDCAAPCEVVCPASMPIPELIRHLRAGDREEAVRLIRREIPLAGILERICSAPCEKGCRRAQVDTGVNIHNVCRYIADLTEEEFARKIAEESNVPEVGKRVGIIGAGPAGLATAFFLSRKGVRCTIVDDHPAAGGMLRGGAIPLEKITEDVLDMELKCLLNDRVTLDLGKRIGRDVPFDDWMKDFDAVVLTIGQICDPDEPPPNMKNREPHPSPARPSEVEEVFGVKLVAGNIKVDRKTGMTSRKGVFAGGDAGRFHRMAVRAVGDARSMAAAVYLYVTGNEFPRLDPEFNCSMGKLKPDELERMMHRASPAGRHDFAELPDTPLPEEEVLAEAERCMACDCAARHDCGLREYSDQFGAKQNRFKPNERPVFEEETTHPLIVHELGKCIRCSICIRLTEIKEEPVGLAAMGRGADKHPAPPHGHNWGEALTITPEEYAEKCPVGAIALHRKSVKKN